MQIRICSWCGECMGTNVDGDGITHGICQTCEAKVRDYAGIKGPAETAGERDRAMKRGRDGRFVSYHCDLCQDEGKVMCQTCSGSGIGRSGPIETSRCTECNGRGAVPCPGEEHCEFGLSPIYLKGQS